MVAAFETDKKPAMIGGMYIRSGPQALQLMGLRFEGWHGYLFADGELLARTKRRTGMRCASSIPSDNSFRETKWEVAVLFRLFELVFAIDVGDLLPQ